MGRNFSSFQHRRTPLGLCGVFHDERYLNMIDHVTIRFDLFSHSAIPRPRPILRPGDKFGLHATWRQVWTSFKTFYVSTTWPQGLSFRAFGTLLGMLLRGAPGWDFWLFTGRQHGQSVGSTGGCWRRPQTEIAGNGTIRDG